MELETRILLPKDDRPILSLGEYKANGGMQGYRLAQSMTGPRIIEEVKRAGLRGRGGAGFPTSIKWTSVFGDPSDTKYLVCNGSEGEPGTFKDRYLIRMNPYQLIEGMMIAAHTIGAKQAFIGLKGKFTREIERVNQAIAEMEQDNVAPEGYLVVVLGPDEYLFGEEKALLEVIDGRGAMPRILPPFMQGVRFSPTQYNPTVVNNVESLSNLPQILTRGGEWYRAIGSKDTPGTMIFTLCGDVKNPGMYELTLRTTLHELIYDIGGGPVGEHPIKAVFSGVANKVMTPEMFDSELGFGTLRKAGGGLGSAGFIVYDESMCMVKVAHLFSSFLAKESCGQCLPCTMGCRSVTDLLRKLEGGLADADSLECIMMECGKVTNQNRCYLPAEEQILIRSLIEKFAEEFKEHTRAGCASFREPVLPLIEDFNEMTGQFTFSDNAAGGHS